MTRSFWLATSLMLAAPIIASLPKTSAYAQTKKPKKPSAANQKLYQEAMKKARTTQTKGDAKSAIPLFQEALKAIPDDPRALAELGYAAYVAKDYTLAKESTEKSLKLSQDPNLRGAAYYNLGLILVAQGDNKGAVEAYTISFYSRPNKTVLSALQKLDAEAAALVDPFTAGRPQGIDSPEGYYSDNEIEDLSEYKKIAVDGDYLEAKIMEGHDMRSSNYDLFVKTKLGWHQIGLVGGYTEGPGSYSGFSISKVSYEDAIKGGSKEILIEAANIYHYEDINTEILYDSEDTYLFVCSLNEKTPSCVEIQLSHSEKSAPFGNLDDSYNVTSYTKEQGWRLSYSFDADGKLTVKQDALLGKTKKLPAEAAFRVGTKALTFRK